MSKKFLSIFEREQQRLTKQLKAAESKVKHVKTDLQSIGELIAQNSEK